MAAGVATVAVITTATTATTITTIITAVIMAGAIWLTLVAIRQEDLLMQAEGHLMLEAVV